MPTPHPNHQLAQKIKRNQVRPFALPNSKTKSCKSHVTQTQLTTSQGIQSKQRKTLSQKKYYISVSISHDRRNKTVNQSRSRIATALESSRQEKWQRSLYQKPEQLLSYFSGDQFKQRWTYAERTKSNCFIDSQR